VHGFGLCAASICAILTAAPLWRVSAQDSTWTSDSALVASRSPNLTRADLEGLAQRATRLAASDAVQPRERVALSVLGRSFRERLTEGDFEPGDEILLRVDGQDSLSGTFSVREKQLLTLPTLPDISLRGVLHSELRQYLTREIGRYVRDPEVRATALVRIAVLGEVRNPGFYRLASDVPLSDALTLAGGPTPQADLTRSVVKRNAAEVIPHGSLSQALARGATLDQLSIRAGDEVFVGERHHWNWQATVQSAVGVLGVLVSYQLLHRR
jgi:protein involved in polysaccharide export with SLBB domain